MSSAYQHSAKDKIIDHYLRALRKDENHVLIVRKLLARGYRCRQCGACCSKFTLDYIPGEPRPDSAEECEIEYDGDLFTIFSDRQEENETEWCKYLTEDGKCEIYDKRPLSCDFELIRIFNSDKKPESEISCLAYMRAHSMVQYIHREVERPKGVVPKQYRPLCQEIAPNEDSADDNARKLRRLRQWADYFHIDTWIPEVIEYLDEYDWMIEDQRFTLI
jgi:Fe-S-cluster containining protein